MRLSDHFYLSELTRSHLAVRHAIANQPAETEICALRQLCIAILEPVRRHFDVPIVPSSGFRCRALNRLLGSADTSSHCRGEAVDFEVMGISNLKLAHWMAENLHFDQLILEFPNAADGAAGWVHVSFKNRYNRGQCLTRLHSGYEIGLPQFHNPLRVQRKRNKKQ